ncbi:MAG: serine hydrolase [Gemmatimonadota bacterium]
MESLHLPNGVRDVLKHLKARAVAYLCAAASASAQAQVSTDSNRVQPPPSTVAELVTRIRQLLDSSSTPGAGLAIVRNDSVIYTGGFGLARIETKQPANERTLFRIGSTSKAFVALVAMQLQREGRLSINDPIKQHIPDFWYGNEWETTDPVRIVHLLEHTSGFDDNSLLTYASSDPTPLTLEQGLALDSTTRVSRWRPGTMFSYCNTGPAIVALIIERIEKKPFEQVVQQRFFDPIGMRTATYFFPDTSRVEMASLYASDTTRAIPYWHVSIRPAGSINASALDMAQYLRFLLGRGTIDSTVLLPRVDIERMERPATWIGRRAGLEIGYGLHLYSAPDTMGFVWIGHNGGVDGGLSDLSYLPDAGTGYATQINSGDGALQQDLATLVRGFLTLSLTRPSELAAGSMSPAVSSEFAGWYRPVSPRMQHAYFAERILGLQRMQIRENELVVRPLGGEDSRYVAVDSLRFRRPGEAVATLAFHRDPANGRPRAAELGMTSLVRVSAAMAWTEVGLMAGWVIALLLGLVALLFIPVRLVIRRVRGKSATSITAARPLWRPAIVASMLILILVLTVTIGGAGIEQLGNLTTVSGTIYLAGLLYLAWAIFGLVTALRARTAVSRGAAFSLWMARTVLVMHMVGALYLTYWGAIGWKTWS